MARYRKCPEYIEAEQWFPGDPDRDGRLGISYQAPSPGRISARDGWTIGPIPPDHCIANVCPGDWIILSGPLFRYPIRAGEFEKIYEPADEVSA